MLIHRFSPCQGRAHLLQNWSVKFLENSFARNHRTYITLRISKRVAAAIAHAFQCSEEIVTRIGDSAYSIPIELGRFMAEYGPRALTKYRGVGKVAIGRIADAFAEHGIAFRDPVTMSSPAWKRVDDPRNSACATARLKDLDWSNWWWDSAGYIHVRRSVPSLDGPGPDDCTHHRVRCRLTGSPRIAMRDGHLYWLVDHPV